MYSSMTLFTTAKVSRDVYENILRQLGAELTPGGIYDASILRETRSARFSLDTGEEIDLLWEDDEDRERIVKLLGGQAQAAVVMTFNREEGSQNIAIDFALLFAEHYPCVLEGEWRELFPPEKFAGLAQAGYDGYRWDTTHSLWCVIKGPPETDEEKRMRLERARKERLRRATKCTLYSPIKVSREVYERLLRELGGELTGSTIYDMKIEREERLARFGFKEDTAHLMQPVHDELVQALGGEPQTMIDIDITRSSSSSDPSGINLALDVLFAFAERYPCLVMVAARGHPDLYKPTDLLEIAQAGADGYRWNADHTRVVKGPPEMAEERQARLRYLRREKAFSGLWPLTTFSVVSTAAISGKEYKSLVHKAGMCIVPGRAEATAWRKAIYDAWLEREGRVVLLCLQNEQERERLFGVWQISPLKQWGSFVQALGGQPKTVINIYASKYPLGMRLALDFLFQCTRRYSCIITVPGGGIYTLEELQAFTEELEEAEKET